MITVIGQAMLSRLMGGYPVSLCKMAAWKPPFPHSPAAERLNAATSRWLRRLGYKEVEIPYAQKGTPFDQAQDYGGAVTFPKNPARPNDPLQGTMHHYDPRGTLEHLEGRFKGFSKGSDPWLADAVLRQHELVEAAGANHLLRSTGKPAQAAQVFYYGRPQKGNTAADLYSLFEHMTNQRMYPKDLAERLRAAGIREGAPLRELDGFSHMSYAPLLREAQLVHALNDNQQLADFIRWRMRGKDVQRLNRLVPNGNIYTPESRQYLPEMYQQVRPLARGTTGLHSNNLIVVPKELPTSGQVQ